MYPYCHSNVREQMSPNSDDKSAMAFGVQWVDTQPSHRGERADHIDMSRIPSDFVFLSLSITTVGHKMYDFHRSRLRGRMGGVLCGN